MNWWLNKVSTSIVCQDWSQCRWWNGCESFTLSVTMQVSAIFVDKLNMHNLANQKLENDLNFSYSRAQIRLWEWNSRKKVSSRSCFKIVFFFFFCCLKKRALQTWLASIFKQSVMTWKQKALMLLAVSWQICELIWNEKSRCASQMSRPSDHTCPKLCETGLTASFLANQIAPKNRGFFYMYCLKDRRQSDIHMVHELDLLLH